VRHRFYLIIFKNKKSGSKFFLNDEGYMKQVIKMLAMITLITTTANAQPTLKQIVNVPWGSEKDYLRTSLHKPNAQSCIIIASFMPTTGKQDEQNILKTFNIQQKQTFEFRPSASRLLFPELQIEATTICSNGENKVYLLDEETAKTDFVELPLKGLLYTAILGLNHHLLYLNVVHLSNDAECVVHRVE
jgi:hypothetical protein